MTIQAFRTWVVGAPLTAAQLNEQIRDNGNELIKGGLSVVFDGGGGTIATDTLIIVSVDTPYKFTIDAASAKSTDAASSDNFKIDVFVAATASDAFVSTDHLISASAPITLDTDNPSYVRDTTLTGWSPTVAEGSAMAMICTSNGGVTKATISITWTRAS